MTKRIDSIIKLLAKTDDYVSVEAICDVIGIRPRTLREDIRHNRNYLIKGAGLELEMKSNLGYKIVIRDETKYYDYLQKMISMEAQNQFVLPIDQEERIQYIIRFFLGENGYVKSDDLAEEMYISRSTLSSDLKQVKQVLKTYGLSLDSKVGKGLKIEGDERKIRTCISDYYFNKEGFDLADSLSVVNASFDSIDLMDISNVLYSVIGAYRFKMTDIGYQNLVIHLAIAIVRIQDATYVELGTETYAKSPEDIEYKIAVDVSEKLGSYYNVNFPASEVMYIAMHLMGKRVYSLDDDQIIDVETLNLVNRIIKEVDTQRGIPLFGDTELFSMLALHIQPLKTRLGYDMRLHNPLLGSIKKNNAFAFELAILAGQVINDALNVEIDEDELGYIALHFELALSRADKTKRQKKRVAVVCASGAGTSKFLTHKIKEVFKDQIDSITTLSAFELPKKDVSSIDLIISTIPLSDTFGIPTIHVSYQLEDNDVDNIRKAVDLKGDSQNITSCFDQQLYFTNMTFGTKEEVMSFMIDRLETSILLPDDFRGSVFEREKLSSTDLGNNVAMPHPLRLMLDRNIVVFCHLKNAIPWGKNKVNLVFLLGFSKTPSEESEILQHVLFQIYNDTDAMLQLQRSPQMETMFSIIEATTQYDTDSIFK